MYRPHGVCNPNSRLIWECNFELGSLIAARTFRTNNTETWLRSGRLDFRFYPPGSIIGFSSVLTRVRPIAAGRSSSCCNLFNFLGLKIIKVTEEWCSSVLAQSVGSGLYICARPGCWFNFDDGTIDKRNECEYFLRSFLLLLPASSKL